MDLHETDPYKVMAKATEKDLPCAELVVQSSTAGEVVGALCLGPSKQVALVGRSDPCEMQVKHSKVSGKHLQICWHDGSCELTVLGAMGCFWNDSFLEKDSKVWLSDRDVLVLARRSKQDQTQAKEPICRFQFCIMHPTDLFGRAKKPERADVTTATVPAAEAAAELPQQEKKDADNTAQVPQENGAASHEQTMPRDANGAKQKESYIDTQLNKTRKEIQETEEKLRQISRDGEKEEPPKEVKGAVPPAPAAAAVPEPAAPPGASAVAAAASAGGVPAPKTPPQWKSTCRDASDAPPPSAPASGPASAPASTPTSAPWDTPGDWQNWGSWRNRWSRWDVQDASSGYPDRARSRTPARGPQGPTGADHSPRTSHRAAEPERRTRSCTPARGMESTAGAIQTPHRRDGRGADMRRDRSSTPARRDRSSVPYRQPTAWANEVVDARICGRFVETVAKVMHVQSAAMTSLKMMPITQAAQLLLQELDHPQSTGMCAPEAAASWHHKGAGAQSGSGSLELEMNEMNLERDLQVQLMELPEHEVRNALDRARVSQCPERWLKGYVSHYWTRFQNPEKTVELDDYLRAKLNELPEAEATRAMQKASKIADNPRAWLFGYCKRYWKEQQFDRNWSGA